MANEKNINEVSSRSLQIVVFKLGNEEYGLHIDQIKEVVITPNITTHMLRNDVAAPGHLWPGVHIHASPGLRKRHP